MENRINLVELLKDCPKGMELDCTVFEGLEFDSIADNEYLPICCRIRHPDGGYNIYNFTEYGCWLDADFAKCVIFPKGKTTWEGFLPPCKFKDGDVVATKDGSWIGITMGGKRGVFIPTYCVIRSDGKFKAYINYKEKWMFDRFGTEEEKEKLFNVIKDNGYKWNAETKTLEKLIVPKFKVGDRIKTIHNAHQYVIIGTTDTHYTLEEVEEKFRYTEPIIDEKNWELVPNKFDITTLKPFDKVLVRVTDNDAWMPKFFSHYDASLMPEYFPFIATDDIGYPQCIPYGRNEHLCRTTNTCEEYYKTWE